MKNTTVIIADIIWFSVKQEIIIPNEMYDILNSVNPNIEVNTIFISGFPNFSNTKKYINEIINVIIITPNKAKNFPITIEKILRGEISNNCSVPLLLSSENDFIVNNETINGNTNTATP